MVGCLGLGLSGEPEGSRTGGTPNGMSLSLVLPVHRAGCRTHGAVRRERLLCCRLGVLALWSGAALRATFALSQRQGPQSLSALSQRHELREGAADRHAVAG